MQAVETWVYFEERKEGIPLLKGIFEPEERLLVVTEFGADRGDFERGHKLLLLLPKELL